MKPVMFLLLLIFLFLITLIGLHMSGFFNKDNGGDAPTDGKGADSASIGPIIIGVSTFVALIGAIATYKGMHKEKFKEWFAKIKNLKNKFGKEEGWSDSQFDFTEAIEDAGGSYEKIMERYYDLVRFYDLEKRMEEEGIKLKLQNLAKSIDSWEPGPVSNQYA